MYSFIWDLLYQKRKEKFDMKTQVSFWFFLPENSANKTLKIVSLFCANKLNFCRKKGKQGGGGSSYSNIQQIKPYIFFCYTTKTYLISGGTIFFEKGKDLSIWIISTFCQNIGFKREGGHKISRLSSCTPLSRRILKIEFALLLNSYTLYKRVINLKWILKKMSVQYCTLSSSIMSSQSLTLKWNPLQKSETITQFLHLLEEYVFPILCRGGF